MACTNFSPALGAAIRPILAKGSHGSRNSAMAIRKPPTAKFDGRPGIQGSAVSNPGEELLALRNLPGVTPYPDWKARRNGLCCKLCHGFQDWAHVLSRSVAMNDFKGRHFTGEVILWAVRWYCRYGISYRDLEEMLSERGIDVDHTTIYRWVQR